MPRVQFGCSRGSVDTFVADLAPVAAAGHAWHRLATGRRVRRVTAAGIDYNNEFRFNCNGLEDEYINYRGRSRCPNG